MTEKQQYLDSLKDIKDIMDRSSRFISLSGISGVCAGLLALTGAFLAYKMVYDGSDYFTYHRVEMSPEVMISLLAIAMGVLVLSLLAGIFFTTRKAKIQGQSIWDLQSQRLLINLLIPLVTGGILCLTLFLKGYLGLIVPLTLIFYGLALVNASKYTLSDIRGLGLLEIVLGLLAAQFIGYGLFIWALGFGVLHIVYGILMHLKYGS